MSEFDPRDGDSVLSPANLEDAMEGLDPMVSDEHIPDDLGRMWDESSPLREFAGPDPDLLLHGQQRVLGRLRRTELAESTLELGSLVFFHVARGLVAPVVGCLRALIATFSEREDP